MNKYIPIAIILTIISSCAKQDANEQIQYLDGYWSIEKAILEDGTEKEFTISTTIDFMEINGKTGIRKKVQPKLDGTFLTSNDAETFEIKIEDDSLRLYYTTPFDSWKETVLKAKDSSLVVLNPDGKTYFYKKFATFNFQ
ncbi:lipocalin family protein [Rasiella sp. SM2506]|uniref:lipocalin family protein n=1 Tax=Rasiella sp. SM2506 TaxID=3423914 RepID=UPI003D7A0A97